MYKVIKDRYADTARVWSHLLGGTEVHVYLGVQEGGELATLSLTVEQSKELRKALKAAEQTEL